MRRKTNESISKVEPIIASQAQTLYFDKKINLIQLVKEKKEIDNQNMERLIRKTQVYMSQAQYQEQEIKQICNEYGIDLKFKKLPFKEKIRQIFNDLSAFHKYKRDHRDTLDFSIMKSPEYLRKQKQEYKEFMVYCKVKYLNDENLLTEEEKQIYEKQKVAFQRRQHEEIQELDRRSQLLIKLTDKPKHQEGKDSKLRGGRSTEREDNRSKLTELSKNSVYHAKKQSTKPSKDIKIIDHSAAETIEESQLPSLNKLPNIFDSHQGTKIKLLPRTFISDIRSGQQSSLTFSLHKTSLAQSPRDNGSKERLEELNASMDLNNRSSFFNTVDRRVSQRQDLSVINNFNSSRNPYKESQRQIKTFSYQQTPKDILRNMIAGQANLSGLGDLSSGISFSSRQRKKATPLRVTNISNGSPDSIVQEVKIEDYQDEQMPQQTLQIKERLNRNFKMQTPYIQDKDFQEHIRNHRGERFKQIDLDQLDKIRRRQRTVVQTIKKVVDENQKQLEKETNKYFCDRIIQNLKEEQFNKTLDTLQEIGFAESGAIKALFDYKNKSELEQLEQANEVVKEYHSGKLDPLNVIKLEKSVKARNQKRKKDQ